MSKYVVLVTGGSRGIGKAICNKMLSLGYKVAIGYKNNYDLALKVAGQNRNAFPVKISVESRVSIVAAIQNIEDYYGENVGVLVNNAGIAQEKPFETITDEDWDAMMGINLRGVFSVTQEVLMKMKEQQFGRIINVTSIGGQWGGFNQVHYAAAKAAVINFTRSIAKLYSASGILTNAIAVGLVKSDMTENELASLSGKEKVKNIPIGRIGTSDEIANTVAFLASEEASYITGQTINLNGGMYFG